MLVTVECWRESKRLGMLVTGECWEAVKEVGYAGYCGVLEGVKEVGYAGYWGVLGGSQRGRVCWLLWSAGNGKRVGRYAGCCWVHTFCCLQMGITVEKNQFLLVSM